jgi:hypothetical protein
MKEWGHSDAASGSGLAQADLTSQINGSTSIFTLPVLAAAGSVRPYRNGLRLRPVVEFFEVPATNPTQIQLSTMPMVGEWIVVDYLT